MATIEKKDNPPISLEEIEANETHEPTGEDLRFNEAEDSFELDPESEDSEYQHPTPYDTAAPAGEDNNSTYDEENPYTQDEYMDKGGKLEELDAEIGDGQFEKLEEIDVQLAESPEDERADFDDESDGGLPDLDHPDTHTQAEEVPLPDERDPLGDKQIQADDPTETTG